MRWSIFIVELLAIVARASSVYELTETWQGTTFFDHFNFFNSADPTHGYVYYTSQTEATSWNLISTTTTAAFMYADSSTVSSGSGRAAVRVESQNSFTKGLFVLDMQHMPTGCGTWPAFWMVGPNWPNSGEIDIIEGVNVQTHNAMTLHTSDGCDQSGESTSTFSGSWGMGSNNQPSDNCYINAAGQYSNQGCGITAQDGTYGAPLNTAGGGVWATLWNDSVIAIWYWPHGQVPADLLAGRAVPDSWGLPRARFTIGAQCSADHFKNMKIVINLTFCGDWAGGVFGTDCPSKGTCNSYVQNTPSAFSNAYWEINWIKLYNLTDAASSATVSSAPAPPPSSSSHAAAVSSSVPVPPSPASSSSHAAVVSSIPAPLPSSSHAPVVSSAVPAVSSSSPHSLISSQPLPASSHAPVVSSAAPASSVISSQPYKSEGGATALTVSALAVLAGALAAL